MSDNPTFLSLPKLTFLMNGTPAETDALAHEMTMLVPRGCIEYFLEPVTAAVVSIYYGTSPYDGYIAFDKPHELARDSGKTLAYLRDRFRSYLEAEEGKTILGKLARARVEESYEIFSNFLFPDALTGYEIEPLMRRFPNECLLILAPSMTVPTPLRDGPIDVMFATPEDVLAKLTARNEKESAA